MAPQFVKPYVKTNKNDMADAEAICEAVNRPNMRFVPIKNVEQQAILSVHRARQGFVKARTAQANQIRGLLSEFGIIIPQGIKSIAKRMPDILEDAENGLPGTMRHLIERLNDSLKEMDRQVAELEIQIKLWHHDNEVSRKLEAIPGIGPITASAIVATVGNATEFKNGRQLAAWLGAKTNQILIELHKQYNLVLSSMTRIDALTKSVESSTFLVEAMQKSVKKGLRNNLDTLNAQHQLFTAKRDLSQARYTYLLSYLKLRKAAGTVGVNDIQDISNYFVSNPQISVISN
jgi:hypothetical protein